MKSIRVSTVFMWIISQTILSILFYFDDNFISSKEAIVIFFLSIPLTIFIQWMRGEYKLKPNTQEVEDTNSDI